MRGVILLIFILCLTFAGCDEVVKCLEEKDGRCGSTAPTPVPEAPVPVPTQAPIRTPQIPQVGLNPDCGNAELSASQHLLYKPVSDTSGNAVLVFDGRYKEEFQDVKIELDTGYETLFWKPLELWGNPDKDGPRQHWRSRNKCKQVKKNGLIIARDSRQTCKFRLKGKKCERQE